MLKLFDLTFITATFRFRPIWAYGPRPTRPKSAQIGPNPKPCQYTYQNAPHDLPNLKIRISLSEIKPRPRSLPRVPMDEVELHEHGAKDHMTRSHHEHVDSNGNQGHLIGSGTEVKVQIHANKRVNEKSKLLGGFRAQKSLKKPESGLKMWFSSVHPS